MATATKSTKKTTKPAKKSAVKKVSALDVFETYIRTKVKKLKYDDIMTSLDASKINKTKPHLPTGVLALDVLIGGVVNDMGIRPCPGFPRKKISQIYGWNSCGKTTVALSTAAMTCARGGTVLFIDFEHEVDPMYAEKLGVPISDKSKFRLAEPDTLEEGYILIMVAAKAGVDLIVIDSVGAGITNLSRKYDDNKKLEGKKGQFSQVAAFWSTYLPEIKAVVAKSNTAMLGISQLRSNPGSTEPTVQGGNAWPFYTAVRIKLSRIGSLKISEYDVMSHKILEEVRNKDIIRARLDKTKVSDRRFKEQDFYIEYGKGVDNHHTVLDIAVAHKFVEKSGSYWSFSTGIKCHGLKNTLQYLKENDDVFQEIYQQVVPVFSKTDLSNNEGVTTVDLDASAPDIDIDFDGVEDLKGKSLEDIEDIANDILEASVDGTEVESSEDSKEISKNIQGIL